MSEPIAYWQGAWTPISQLTIPLDDAGFMLGTTVAEQLRTFSGKIFKLDDHLDRLWNSLDIVGVTSPESRDSLKEVVSQIIEHNHPLLPAGADLGVTIFVTPGPMGNLYNESVVGQLAVHTQRVPFSSFGHLYEHGQALVVPDTRQIPVECWPRELKVRSRVHYYLADLKAKRIDPNSRAVLLDLQGHVMEATTANIAKYHPDTGLELPPAELVLPGISIATLCELADVCNIPYTHRNLLPEDFAKADEVLLTSTSPCVLPCSSWDGKPISVGKPGPIFKQLIEAWEEMVDCPIRQQALRFGSSH